jgi:sec-independent protein translocase protein TatA
MNELLVAFMGVGPTEMLIVMFIILLLFGSQKLPSLMRNLGSSAREFKKGVQGMDEEISDANRSLQNDKTS